MHFLTVALFGVLICNAVGIPFFKGTRSTTDECSSHLCFHRLHLPEEPDIVKVVENVCKVGDEVMECLESDNYIRWTKRCTRLSLFETNASHFTLEVQALEFALNTICSMPINETIRQVYCIPTMAQSLSQCRNQTLSGKSFTRNDLYTRTSNTPTTEVMCSYVDELYGCVTTVIANQCGQEGRSTTIATFVANNLFRQGFNYDGNCQTESEFEAALESFGLK